MQCYHADGTKKLCLHSNTENVFNLHFNTGLQPRGKTCMWTYLLIVLELDIKPAGLDHPCLFCS